MISPNAKAKQSRAPKREMIFTDLALGRLSARKQLAEINSRRRKEGRQPVNQFMVWDKDQGIGLALLVGRRTKTFRVQYKDKAEDQWKFGKIGRFGPVKVQEARTIANAWYETGIDPREVERRKKAEEDRKERERLGQSTDTYGQVVELFIENYAKPRQRTWDQTERILKKNCADWLERPVRKITGDDVRALLRGFIAKGKKRKAGVTKSWLKKFWKWAYHEGKVDSPLIQGIDNVEVVTGGAERFYSDAEVKTIWNAASKLPPIERDFIKLLLLLAPRKTALAAGRRNHIKPVPLMSGDRDGPKVQTLVTPFELTKSRKTSKKKRVYLTPLPPEAQRIIKNLTTDDDLLFPGLRLYRNKKTDQLQFHGHEIGLELIRLGAPKDFTYHALRHTLTTWLQDRGYSEYERGLILNHSGSGTVTDIYSHGYPLALKQKMLTEWAAHVQFLVQSKSNAKRKRKVA